MQELTITEIDDVAGGLQIYLSNDAAYGGAIGTAGGFLALGLTVSAPAWVPFALLGGSIVASGLAIRYALGK
jgi:hypothetical protein